MTIGLFTASRLPEALEYLQAEGYVILENLLAESQLVALREQVATVLEAESSNPPDPGPASSALADDDLRAYFIEHYSVSPAELERMLRFIRWTRSQQLDTPWPVPVGADGGRVAQRGAQ